MQRIGDVLVETGVVDRETVERVAQEIAGSRITLGEALVREAHVDERDLYRALAQAHDIPFESADSLHGLIDPKMTAAVPRRFQDHEHVLPLYRDGKTVVVASPDIEASFHMVASAVGAKRAKLVLVTPTDYRRLRAEIDLKRIQAPDIDEPSGDSDEVRDLLAPGADAEMVALFYSMLLDAIAERASDIHLERYQDRVRVRLRVDGDLHDVVHYQLTPDQLLGVVNVVKIQSDLDIAERRMPQGGRARVQAGGHPFDLRVQTQPTLHGEHVIIRLLPQDASLISISELGFPPELATQYERLIDSPQGLLLVVGPTGSGKSTTLYAGLQLLAADPTRKVLTIEDPIEYSIENVQQSAARPELGFSFAQAMRAFVREDPDVILVGEIRDGETALEAIRASQTGHLVLSTLHCNDTVDAVQRLVDLGMHPNSIASELLAVIAQRLAKRICTRCRVPDEAPDIELLNEIFPMGVPEGFQPMKGKGCVRCAGYGNYGRVAAVELLPASAGLRRAISKHLALDDLRDEARAAGLVSLRENALRLVADGVIQLEELRDMLPPEQLAPPDIAPIDIDIGE
jgi:type IV pilus assembly protein PilB